MCETRARVRTYARLRREGRTRRGIEASIAAGTLEGVRHGVYADRGVCDAVRTAALHGGGPGCVCAARHHTLWVLDEDADTPHVWLNHGGHGRRHEACACVAHWDAEPGADAFGIPSVPRVLRQILACQGVEAFFVSLESALHQRMLAKADLAWLRTHTNAAARDAIAFARRDAESGLESLLRWRLRRFGLTIRAQVSITGVGRVDFVIGEVLIVEVDGKPNHDGDTHRHKDLVRDANAALWGYSTLRFDYALVVHDWELVEAAILAKVAAGAHLRAQ